MFAITGVLQAVLIATLFPGSEGGAFLDFFRPCVLFPVFQQFLYFKNLSHLIRYARTDEQLWDETIRGYCSKFKPPYRRKIEADWTGNLDG